MSEHRSEERARSGTNPQRPQPDDTPAVAGAAAADAVLAGLAELLPRYMVPSRLEVVAELPLTPNGKLDRGAIQRLFESEDGVREFVAPRTALESALAAIVGEVLDVERVGADDDFFALGGDSVLATALVARVREWLDAPNAIVADAFAGRTVAGLAARLIAGDGSSTRLEEVAAVYLEVAAMSADELAQL